ncbi:MAG: hypothetical protein KGJ52_09915, partial [Gammaproteobacteria bacterium]|nr:hypothetical protein [Gammaproteobacteria bacterium]
ATSQAINPFSYVMNNPLALIDPSGYSWLSKLFHSIGKVVLTVLAIAALIISPVMLYVGMQIAIGGSVMMGLGFAAYGLGIGLIAANQLHLPAWANELIALTCVFRRSRATIPMQARP